jgi:hypothetical protein
MFTSKTLLSIALRRSNGQNIPASIFKTMGYLFCAMLIFSWVQCASKPEYQSIGEKFIQTYYIEINPKGALDYARGVALEKLELEIKRLAGMSPALPSERPEMSYKILACKVTPPDSPVCDFKLNIKTDKLRVVDGQLTLRKVEEKWWVTQFTD